MPRRRRQRKSNKRSSKGPSQPEEWYTIRQILDERIVKGQVEYLVDWDDNVNTGEVYPPSWVRISILELMHMALIIASHRATR